MSDYKADLSPFSMRARGFIGQGRIEDALGLYGDVITLDPNYALAYADRGTAYAMMEKFDLALADLERAAERSVCAGYLTSLPFNQGKERLHRAISRHRSS